MEDVPNIALRAYQLWDAAGRPEGRSEEFYFAAEDEFRLMIEQKTALGDDGSRLRDDMEGLHTERSQDERAVDAGTCEEIECGPQ